ncbi:MAG: hypothetical protein OXI92_07030 [Acidobacteriota bacterium]|nr:hypothetical protein [Acidobacteriota bacterium]
MKVIDVDAGTFLVSFSDDLPGRAGAVLEGISRELFAKIPLVNRIEQLRLLRDLYK